MASRDWHKQDTLKKLLNTPRRYQLYQANRLLELITPDAAIRFVTNPSLSYPSNSINNIILKADELIITVNCLGLIGRQGILPDHDKALTLQQAHLKNHTLQDFFGIFQHQIIILLILIWKKTHPAFELERALQTQHSNDTLRIILRSIIGVDHMANIHVDKLLYYSGLLAHHPKSAAVLSRFLSSHFQIPISVLPYQTQIVILTDKQASCLSKRHCQLGIDLLLGHAIQQYNYKVRLYLGPLNYAAFKCFLPEQAHTLELTKITHWYLGPEFAFDLQLELKADDIPLCTITKENYLQLGFNTWLTTHGNQSNKNDLFIKGNEMERSFPL